MFPPPPEIRLWITSFFSSDNYAIIPAVAKKKKRVKRSKSAPSPKKKRSLLTEICGVILVFAALFLMISLFSYDPSDPSWASGTYSATSVDAEAASGIHNYGGRVGAACAETLLQLIGFTSFLLPLAFLYLAMQSFRPVEKRRLPLNVLGVGFSFFILCPLFWLLLKDIAWREAAIRSGGAIGRMLGTLMVGYFNHTGSVLILFGLLFLLLAFSTHFSLSKVFQMFSRFFGFAFKEVRIKITHYQKEKKREKMRRSVMEKYSRTKPDAQKPKKEKPEKPEKTDKPEKKVKAEKKAKKSKRQEPIIHEPPAPAQNEEYLFPEMAQEGDYQFPPLNLLDVGKAAEKIDKNELYEKKHAIEEKLNEFKVEGEVREYHPGPILTTYEYYPRPGIKVSQVANLSEDLSLALGAESVRIQRIPGKSSLGMEIPNNVREVIKIRDVIQSEKFRKSRSKLTIALGKTIHGEDYVTDLSNMPHMLIAGATGSGKSVALNTLIASILYKATPDEVKLILIDPKRLEFSLYDGVPHLICPVVKDPRKAQAVLMDAIRKMEARYHKLGHLKVKNIEQYNQQVRRIMKEQKANLSEAEQIQLKPLPYIVIIIDELAELMMESAREVEYCIARLAQLARAVGIHLVLATQRPSTDVITGTIKNNFPSRIAFRVPSRIDSRVIIDTIGAEKLLGKGDMLFMPPNYPRILRLHCSFISLPEVTRLINFVKEQAKPDYDENIIQVLKDPAAVVQEKDDEKDALFENAAELILMTGQASASYLQRKLKLGYARAARIIDQLEQEGIVGPSEGSKPREILMDEATYRKKFL